MTNRTSSEMKVSKKTIQNPIKATQEIQNFTSSSY